MNRNVTDEFVKPVVHVENNKPVAVIEDGDVVKVVSTCFLRHLPASR